MGENHATLENRIAALSQNSGQSPLAEVQQALATNQDYDHDEVGLVNPSTKAAVKLSKDGCLNLFVAGNTGIRIDPANATINLFGRIQTQAASVREWIAEDLVTEVKQAWTIKCEGAVQVQGRTVEVTAADTVKVNAGGDLTVQAGGKLAVDSKGDLAVNSKGSLAVRTDGSLLMEAAKDVRIKAGGYIDFE